MGLEVSKPNQPPGMAGAGHDALDVLYRFVAAIELTPMVAVYSFDRDGVIRFWNHASGQLYGAAAQDAIGQKLSGLVSHGADGDEFAQCVGAIWQTGLPAPSRDWNIRRPDGRELWIYSAMFPVFRDGQLYQIFRMDIDITERKREEAAMAQLGSNFAQLFERSPDAILLLKDDAVLDANPASLALFGHGRKDELVGRKLHEFAAPGFQACSADNLAARARDGGSRRFEMRILDAAGAPFWSEVLLTSIRLNSEFMYYAVIRDISARKADERALYLAAQVFENTHDAILIADAARRVVAANRAFTDITGYGPQDIIGNPLHEYGAGAHDGALYARIWDEVARADHWQGEIWDKRKSGERYPAWMALTAIRDSEHKVTNYMATLSDITERKAREAQTRHQAEHDYLTDLPNRVLLLDRLSLALAAAHRKQTMLALLFLDLDRFKAVNDCLGHHAGDLVLKEVAVRLLKCVRSVDTVSRQGGDEFVIILSEIGGVDQAAHVASSVLQAIAQVDRADGHPVTLSASIGISVYPDDGSDIEALLKHADVAMYHAKEAGRNDFRFFSTEMNAHVVERVQMENSLRMALANGEFVLDYLPEVEIDSGRTIALEALIRWRHPQRGWLLPNEFLPAAEECGLIVEIGTWVLRSACRQAMVWRRNGYPVAVAVNLSVAQFLQPGLVHCVRAALTESGLAPPFLELEITERVIMNGKSGMLQTLTELRELGIVLTIDDFGTGYSSLSNLRRFPLDKLKIDQSFIGDISADPDDAAIIPAIIAMAKSMKLKVIAEGVETAEQLNFLRHHGCDEYQGHYASSAPDSVPLSKLIH